ncbi:methyltransferase domain-containing protein [Kibdelosporangium persicum]|uniref:Class I SAM-dependent methyltransferase n=1 Tax=Kibdelosporangium persicum TaxID=2698649 RepID=A0ABX2F9Z0_9PSEU|nr:methyltransferase domain-containing protein [Kibdelosporangium persicum]NRN67603.1 Class I SAM-dependent methyltransferase [Kibdelosporangium persicum]
MIAWILFGLVVACLVVDTLRLRGRASGLRVLPEAAGDSEDFQSFPARLPEDVRQSAVEFARAEDLGLVDLIPANLPTIAALDLLNQVEPKTYRGDRWVRGISAGEAIVFSSKAVDKLGIRQPADPTEFVTVARRVKDREGVYVDLAVAPTLPSGPYDLSKRAARLRKLGKRPALSTSASVIGYLAVLGVTLWTWPWGLIAAGLYSLQPVLAFAGTPLRPKDLWLTSVLRAVYQPYLWVRTLGGRWRTAAEIQQEQEMLASVPSYQEEIDRGVDRFFEPRRESCPTCGSADLEQLVRAVDLVQRKPGEFRMDRCVSCGHVFQNPRLSTAGLDFYYRDFYDGHGAGAAEAVFAGKPDPYYDRARMVQPFTTPRNWLDVGSGHAHFCLGAKEILPDTRFDGLDQGASIEDAVTLGRVTAAYRGNFKDFADQLRGRYDVISMHHYLEHVRDPWDELDIAADTLPDGGYLLIEVPDPEWRLGRLFGKYWMPWFQPQHQHMLPIANLKQALAERGLRPVAEERGKAHLCNDFVLSSYLFLASIAPRSPAPWRPAEPRLKALRSALVWSVGIPWLVVAGLLDKTVNQAIARRTDRGNAYRVLARKEST